MSLESLFQSIGTLSTDDIEKQLHLIHKDAIHDSQQTELLILVLHSAAVPPSSIISSWFDLVLRPALRDPNLSNIAVRHAKSLVLSAVGNKNFAKQLFHLYLLDAVNKASELDVIELAAMDRAQRLKAEWWSANLEDILLKFCQQDVDVFLEQVNLHYAEAHARLQLCLLLDQIPSPCITFDHPLFHSLLHSLLLDNSATLCAVALGLVSKVIPHFTHDTLKRLLSTLLAILARMCDWGVVNPRDGLQWEPFQSTSGKPPDPHHFFSLIYYLFPCNVLHFLQNPTSYLTSAHLECPYEAWPFDDELVKRTAIKLMKGHALHPSLLFFDAQSESVSVPQWAEYECAQRVSEAGQLVLAGNVFSNDPPPAPLLTTAEDASDLSLVSSLQTQLLLLRTQLNFEMWTTANNTQHIQRLSSDGSSKASPESSAESSHLALLSKLRTFRATISSLEAQNTELRNQNTETKRRYIEWNRELQEKHKTMRDEMRALRESQRGELGGGNGRELKARFDAQAKLLASANHQVFALQVQIQETAHKVALLHDYEAQIQQHLQLQKMWDEDFRRFTARENELEQVRSQATKMQLRVRAVEQEACRVETEKMGLKKQVHALQMQLQSLQSSRHSPTHLDQRTDRTNVLSTKLSQLRAENAVLYDEVEELRAMVEVLRGRAHAAVSGVEPFAKLPEREDVFTPTSAEDVPEETHFPDVSEDMLDSTQTTLQSDGTLSESNPQL